ncbi:MAG: alpha-amylase family glycosyl hydrolase, partial [Sediminibacterium sp.]|nr:alpha-amylase family glycosyl hydrolase [Sediminibacterium sp.]
MKYLFLILVLFFYEANQLNAQLLQWSPQFITESSSNIVIIANANNGNKALLNFNGDVFVHIGVITNKSTSNADWKHVPFTWGVANNAAKSTYLNNNKWQFSINQNLRSFFNITDVSEKILKLAILFRSTDGNTKLANSDGSDMFIPIYDDNFSVRIDSPAFQPTYIPSKEPISKKINDTIGIIGNANKWANLSLYYNDSLINAVTNNTIQANIILNKTGDQKIVLRGNYNNTFFADSILFIIAGNTVLSNLPAGLQDGINYESGDTSVVLVQYAPNKKSMLVIGDFNNWTESANYLMNKTNDSNRYWIRITGLTPGVEYGYQFVVDGNLKVGDMYAEKILDLWNDLYINDITYPNLKPYPTNKTTGIVSVLQTKKSPFIWTNNFIRPNKNNLIIYELLIRDFVQTHNYQTLLDTLPYFKKLGINAIELMPISEFEGNESWGYNPNYFFALDKYYGNEIALKKFIDACHNQGIAVIMDIVLNHCFGSSPIAQLYWDAANNRPAENNPWLNPIAKHDYNVGNDFNHESPATQYFVNRVIKYWLNNFNIDGFRWDLSKGFTQKNTLGSTSNFALYDASRVAIWKRIYDTMQGIKPTTYCILEHFADNSEEIELSNYGMMIWGNANYNFSQAAKGINTDWNFGYAVSPKIRGWNNLNLVAYQESHDEERLMYNNLNYGSSNINYNIKYLNTALKRQELTAAFWALIPGPKLLWQMGELGYDFSINTCTDNSINNNCRLANKPIKWDYLSIPERKNVYNMYSKLFALKLNPVYANTFSNGLFNYNFSTNIKWFSLQNDSLSIFVMGNFDVQSQTTNITFPYTGLWSNYLGNETFLFNNNPTSITLNPGQYYVLLNKNKNTCVNNTIPSINRVGNNLQSSTIFKNYNWYLGGALLTTTDINTITPTFPGVYTLKGIDSNSCTTIESKKYYFSPSCITPTGRLGNAVSIQSNIVNENQIIIKWCPEFFNNNLIIQFF